MDDKRKARVLAYYLPQFHPIPENDKWWGKGFTEWTNVGKAKRYFPGHYQPRVPADLGYYDLRVPETREAQANLAREYGIEGFVYWHYWFGNGKRLLERPFNEVLASGKPDFPFALAWANETWKGFWHGLKDRNVLIEQQYPGDEDYVNHFNAVLPAFKDPRYITCEGKPLFFVYRPLELPDVRHFISLWQELAKKNGLRGIAFVSIRSELYDLDQSKKVLSETLADGFSFLNVHNNFRLALMKRRWRALRKIFHEKLHWIPDLRWYSSAEYESPIDSFDAVIPGLYSNWNHTPRTKREGKVVIGATPARFGQVLRKAVEGVQGKPFERRFVMIKSWNEWAEGNYLEPDLRYGHQYLQAVKDAVVIE